MSLKRHSRLKIALILICLLLFLRTVGAVDTAIEQVSVSSAGVKGNDYSWWSSISDDGRYVTFGSNATNLVAGDTDGVSDIFLRDRLTGQTTLITRLDPDVLTQFRPDGGFISGSGRYIVFSSSRSDLVANDTNGKLDVFVYDIQTGIIRLASGDTNGIPGNDESYWGEVSGIWPPISADGRYVTFESYATNLVLNDTNGKLDIFVHDMQTGLTTRASVDSSGVQGDLNSFQATISRDGRYVVFGSIADNLVPNDTNNNQDVFMHDMQTGVTALVSVNSSGVQANNSSSDGSTVDGRYIVFDSIATNLAPGINGLGDFFLHDMQTGITTLVSVDSAGVPANSYSGAAHLSADGRYIIFWSNASNLVSGDSNGKVDAFIHDMKTGVTARVGLSAAGIQGNDVTRPDGISADGRYITLSSQASNLVPGDINGRADVFVVVNPLSDAPNRSTFTALPLKLTWSKITWATGYEVQVSRSATFTGAPDYAVTTTGSTPETTIASLPIGVYYWRVRAKKADGTTGGWSVAETFTLALP
jgi:hypothetical protein